MVAARLDSAVVQAEVRSLVAHDWNQLWVGFSGGPDSAALMHLLATSSWSHQVRLLHVDHGLQPLSADWAIHCEKVSARFGLPCTVIRADVCASSSAGPEAAARDARYAAFASVMAKDDVMLLAHHQDDQAETLLLQLLRGSGSAGLAAMPGCRRFGGGWLVRPLLPWSREDLTRYVKSAGLATVSDPHNTELIYDRVFVRNEILPRLKQRWPQAARQLAASARQAGEDLSLVRTLANSDLALVADRFNTLRVSGVAVLTMPRRRALVREWLRQHGWVLPPQRRLLSFLEALEKGSHGKKLLLRWAAYELRVFAGRIYAVEMLGDPPTGVLTWGGATLTLPDSLGVLTRNEGGEKLEVRFRTGGEKLVTATGVHRSLKDILREAGVVPWRRGYLPLIFRDGHLVAVAGLPALGPGDPGVRWLSGPRIR